MRLPLWLHALPPPLAPAPTPILGRTSVAAAAAAAAAARQPGAMAASLDKRIGFIGSGNMAEALARGLMKKGLVTGDKISCSDPSPARKDLFRGFGAVPYESNLDVSEGAKRGGHQGQGQHHMPFYANGICHGS